MELRKRLTGGRAIGAAALAGLTALAAGGGCGGGAARETEPVPAPIFYPPPPDQPRLQFLLSFNDAQRWVTRRSTFADFIVGPGPEQERDPSLIVNPYGVEARDGKVYVCDVGVHAVHVFDVAEKAYSRLGTIQQIENPVNITIAPDGTKYVCDTGKGRVAVYGPDDRFVRYLGDPRRCTPSDLAIWNDTLIVTDIQGAKVEVWSRDGTLLKTISRQGLGPDELRRPTNLAVGPDGLIFVSDTDASTVKVFDQDGKYVRAIGQPGDRPGFFARPKGIAIDPDGNVYVADAQWEIVQIFTSEGRLLLYFGGAKRGPEGMGLPAGLSIDATSLGAFGQSVSPDFEPEYLLLLANQFGVNKVGVYAFGHSKRSPQPSPSS